LIVCSRDRAGAEHELATFSNRLLISSLNF
jgi:hypothetical protein